MILKTTLTDQQKEAVLKLLPLKIGALYMKMGKGKTLTALAMAARRLNAGRINALIWLCPCQVRDTIKFEIDLHTSGDRDKIHVYGIESLSTSVRLNAYLMRIVQNNNVMLVIDESTLIQNYTAYRTTNIIRLSQYAKYKLLLNGTPISNNEADLFAQWYALDWRVLGYRSYWSFAANHLEYDEKGRIRRSLNVDYISEKIAPYTYLNFEDDNLPPRYTHTASIALTDEQFEHYSDVMEKYLPEEEDDHISKEIYRLFTVCQLVTSGRYIVNQPKCKPIKSEPFFDNIYDNPRIIELLNDVSLNSGRKTIIWCKYTHEIIDVCKALRDNYGEDSVCLLYGGISKNKRRAELLNFADHAQFLVANKNTGKFGLNLQYSNQMIFYSNDFSWYSREQAEFRQYRRGQTMPCHITDLVAEYTIDNAIMRSLSRKENLADCFKREIKNAQGNKNNVLKSLLMGGSHAKSIQG